MGNCYYYVQSQIGNCDRRMLRYMAGVTWRDRVRSAEVARRCGVRESGDVLRVRRLGVVRA